VPELVLLVAGAARALGELDVDEELHHARREVAQRERVRVEDRGEPLRAVGGGAVVLVGGGDEEAQHLGEGGTQVPVTAEGARMARC